MKISVGLALCAGIFPVTLFAQAPLTIDQRFALLEQRLHNAEKRADYAESEMKKLKNTTINTPLPPAEKEKTPAPATLI